MPTRRKERRLRIAANRRRRKVPSRRAFRSWLAVRKERQRFAMHDGRPFYYDRKGQPIWNTSEWADLFEDTANKRVARDVLPVPGVPAGEAFVSTVWLGIDHSFGDGPPLIFETMVFSGTVESNVFGRRVRHMRNVGNIQLRYHTEAEALAGHADVLARCLEFIASVTDSPEQHSLADGDDESGERESDAGIVVRGLLPSG